MNKIDTFVERLQKIGINVELGSNYPWVYLLKVDGQSVQEKHQSDYGFTLAWMPIRPGQEINFIDIKTIFKTIRKYV